MSAAHPAVDPMSFTFGGSVTEVLFDSTLDLSAAALGADTVTVFDSTTRSLFGEGAVNPVVLPAGESAKDWRSVESILDACLAVSLGRDGRIVGVGGGVVCDIAAFSASVYMRGCGLVLAPTTLLAMLDASLGGKTGMDFRGYKNLVGTFYPASVVRVCSSCLKYLPEREYLSGLAEAIKSAIIGDPDLFRILVEERARIMAREPALVQTIVRRCLAVKGRIVSGDPREAGPREVLNLGHTFGHALESVAAFVGWTHGEAVAWGIGRALKAGVALGITDPRFAGEAEELIGSYGFRLSSGVDPHALSSAMRKDKKRRAGAIRLVIPRGLGEILVRDFTDEEILQALSYRKELGPS